MNKFCVLLFAVKFLHFLPTSALTSNFQVNSLMSKCVKLDSLVKQAAEDRLGNSEYVNGIRAERDEYCKKLQHFEQELASKEDLISRLEEKYI